MPTVIVCLSGSGFMDGSEIHEAAQTLLALDQAGADAVICAPEMPQARVIDHKTRKPSGGERRSVLAESARIARGRISNIAELSARDADALIFPGGFGVAHNLCTFAGDSANCSVHPEVERLILEMHAAEKPIGAICIAPVLVARVLGRKRIAATLTIGDDPETAKAIERMGCHHRICRPGGWVADEEHRIVSTPAYMYDSRPAVVFEGIHGMVGEVMKLASMHACARH